MASRRLEASLAYPRRAVSTRGATRVDYHSLVLVIGLLALAAFAGVLYLSQASLAAELRYRLSAAEGQKQDLWERNLALREAISRSTRLASIEERANRLGMVDAPIAGSYVACAVPQAGTALARRAAGSASMIEDSGAGSPWQGLLSGLRARSAQPDVSSTGDVANP